MWQFLPSQRAIGLAESATLHRGFAGDLPNYSTTAVGIGIAMTRSTGSMDLRPTVSSDTVIGDAAIERADMDLGARVGSS